jgi:tetratricopeptide (TPR) repeat protein
MATDLNALFSRAEAAFRAGRLQDARRDLLVLRQAIDHPTVLHLLGLVERRLGHGAAAKVALERALALAPGDAQIPNNLGNVLADLGEDDAALRAYGNALAADPNFTEARLNQAIQLVRQDRLSEARQDLEAVLAANPKSAAAWRVLGGLERNAGNLASAAEAFDRALELEPGHRVALMGRGRIALERGEHEAASLFAAASAALPDDAPAVIGRAEALEAQGDPAAEHVLAGFVTRKPGEAEAQRVLARMRWEAGDAEGFTREIERALAARPADVALHRVMVETLAGADLFAQAADAARAARSRIAEAHEFALREAIHAGEAGDDGRAEQAFASVPAETPLRRVHEARHRLRCGEYERAQVLLDAEREADPASVAAWAFTGIVWRLLGDERAEWLHEQPSLVATRPLPLSMGEIEETAEMLRSLHRTRAFPIGLSLRGGTQTRGALLERSHPVFGWLGGALREVMGQHWAELPGPDERHPLLRHRRAAPAIVGSWSVRLTGAGFHVPHIHTLGHLSSACHFVLPPPEGPGDDGGWLEIGRPPTDLRLDLGPLFKIRPQVGMLALFPSTLFHGTRPFNQGERISVAFDAVAR